MDLNLVTMKIKINLNQIFKPIENLFKKNEKENLKHKFKEILRENKKNGTKLFINKKLETLNIEICL